MSWTITPPLLTAQRGADGNWPTRPAGAGMCVWIDLTTWPSSDPAGFVEGKDVIFDEGIS